MINAFSQTFRRKTPSSFRLNHKSLKKWSVWCTFGQLRFRISGFTWRWKQLASETLRIVSYILTTVESSSTFTWPCIVYVFFQVQPTRCNVIQHSLLLSMLYMFRTVSPPIIRSSKTAHAASGICQTCLLLPLAWVSRSDSPTLAVAASKLDIYQMLRVEFWAPDDGRRSRLKHVEHWQQ